jgi:hypothetical protein
MLRGLKHNNNAKRRTKLKSMLDGECKYLMIFNALYRQGIFYRKLIQYPRISKSLFKVFVLP